MELLGSIIRKYRKNSSLTQKELAKKLNKAESTIRMWELNKNTPPLDTLKELAQILSIPLGDILLSAGYLEEFRDNVTENIDSRIIPQIPSLNEIVKDIVKLHFNYEEELNDFIGKDLKNTNIDYETLLDLIKGEETRLDNSSLVELAETLDMPISLLYLSQNRESIFFDKDFIYNAYSILNQVSLSDIERYRNLKYEEFKIMIQNDPIYYKAAQENDLALYQLFNASAYFEDAVLNLIK